MSKFVETNYLNKKEILKFPNHFVGMTVTVDDLGITANSEGKKIVKAGTVLGGFSGSILDDDSQKACEKNDESAEGVLLNDTDVTYGAKEATMLIHGFVKLDSLPKAPSDEAKKALTQITFIK